MGSITLQGVRKVYPGGRTAVRDLDLEVEDGEFLVLVGPSGCGKSTVLRLVAGLEACTDGSVRIGGHVVDALPPRERDVAMVFQSYALYPHMTVAENMGFALRLAKVSRTEVDRRVRAAADVLGLVDDLGRRPGTLSGGQQQRVAMGRAIVREPQAFLMDEPLSNLDAQLRVEMRAEIAALQRRLGVTTVYVTHDQVEAMTMGDRVAVLDGGVLQQVDTPQRLYDRPCNVFVAGFLGSPAMNLAVVDVGGTAAAPALELGGGRSLALDPGTVADHARLAAHVGGSVVLGVRPEHLRPVPAGAGAPDTSWGGLTVTLVEHLGAELLVHLTTGLAPARGRPGVAAAGGAEEAVFVARCDPRDEPVVGATVDLEVRTDRLHLFDVADGTSLR